MCRVVQNPCVKREIRIKTLATILSCWSTVCNTGICRGASAHQRSGQESKRRNCRSTRTRRGRLVQRLPIHRESLYSHRHCPSGLPETPDGPGNTAPNTIEASKSKLAEAISGAVWRSG
jgi:hypothetical protein